MYMNINIHFIVVLYIDEVNKYTNTLTKDLEFIFISATVIKKAVKTFK